MTTLARAVAALFLLVVVFGAPALELVAGGRSPLRLPDDVTWESVRSGGLTKQVEDGLVADAWLPRQLRPRYQEFMLDAFSITHPIIVLGKDDWLFHVTSVRGFPNRIGWAAIPRTIARMAAAVGWLEENGTHVLIVPVPRKPTMHPEKLPSRWREFTPVYGELIDRLQGAGLWTLDLRAALDPSRGETYLRNDPHWSSDGALIAARAIAEAVDERVPPAERPGERVELTIERQPPRPFRSGLVRMLELEEGSPLWTRFSVLDRAVVARLASGEAFAAPREPRGLAVIGSSFSDGFDMAAMLSALLEREVENRALAGRGGAYRLLDLVEELVLGRRAFPRVLIWEFPEEFPFHDERYFNEPLEQILDVVPGSPYRVAPLPVRSRRLHGVRVAAEEGDELTARADRADAFLEYELDPPLSGDGSTLLAFRVRTESHGELRAEWFAAGEDTAAGSAGRKWIGFGRWSNLVLIRPKSRGAAIDRIRLSPVSRPDAFVLTAPRCWSR